VTIGIQMVLVSECLADIVKFAEMGRDLGVDYAVVKQCAERADQGRALTREDYERNKHLLEAAEALSTETYQVVVKWRKITNEGVKKYDRCHGCEFLPQISGNGDVYNCGACFGNPRFFIGNINRESFKDLVPGERYADVMRQVRTEVDVHRECGTNCRQNEINEFLWELRHPPAHVNFI
jgi:radical SAM protein with 4Fe4S-binding SPASM domain